jgi:hypothetical protein
VTYPQILLLSTLVRINEICAAPWVAEKMVERCLNHAITTSARMKRLNPALLRTQLRA